MVHEVYFLEKEKADGCTIQKFIIRVISEEFSHLK